MKFGIEIEKEKTSHDLKLNSKGYFNTHSKVETNRFW